MPLLFRLTPVIACAALLACASTPPQVGGSDASSGFRLGDRVVLAKDVDLDSTAGREKFAYWQQYEFNPPINPRGFQTKPFCLASISANERIVRAGTVFQLAANGSRAGVDLSKFGSPYPVSQVILRAFNEAKSARAYVYCTPEHVLQLGIRGQDSSGRMMKTREVQLMVRELLLFPDSK